MIFEVFHKNNVVYHFGQFGKKLYLILKGSVKMYIPKSQIELEEEIDYILERITNYRRLIPSSIIRDIQKMKKINPIYGIDIETMPEIDDLIPEDEIFGIDNEVFRPRKIVRALTNVVKPQFLNNIINMNYDKVTAELFSKLGNDTEYMENGICKMKKLKILGPGEIFGEYGLKNNRMRMETSIANGELHVVSLTMKDYKSIFKNRIEKENAKLAFFRQFFPNFSAEALGKFTFEFSEKHFKYSEVLYSQGEQPTEFYVICQGEVQVINLLDYI